MIKVFRRIWQELFSQHNYGFNGKIIIVLTLLIASSMFSQPPPTCEANGNSGFGGAVGEGHFLFTGEFSNPIIFAMTTSGNEINDIFVLYIDTGAPGRNEIDLTVDDDTNDQTIAISNSNAFGNGSIVNFPAGFEASYAVALDMNSGGLWSIPSTGAVGEGELEFVTSVNSTLESNTQSFYEFSFNWEDLGLTSPNEFNFVGLYVSNTAYSSDEGYGEGIAIGTEGSDAITFTGYLTLPGCDAVLSTLAKSFSMITSYYVNGQLFIKGINELAIISVYDLQGRELFRNQYEIQDALPIPLELNDNKLQFIIIESSNKRKVLKVISN